MTVLLEEATAADDQNVQLLLKKLTDGDGGSESRGSRSELPPLCLL